MFRELSLKIASLVIVGSLIVSATGVNPAGAMIFPDLLSLVRVDDKHVSDNLTDAKDDSQDEEYIVKKGDTLWDLSRKYCVDWKTIAYANDLDLNGVIHAGQKLVIPVKGVMFHIVKRGESLWAISRKYDREIKALAAVNNIADPNRLQVGVRLVIPQEQEEIATAFARKDLPSRYEGHWRMPVVGPITSGYGPRGNEFHHGLDIAAEKGEKIYAVRAGTVEFSGWLNNIYGQAVIIDHGDGIRSLYAHNSKNLVKKGDRVRTLTAIAKIGNTGKSTGPHLHFEIYIDGQTVDPNKFVNQ